MLDYSSDDANAIEQTMLSDMAGIVTGMITTSIRSANIDGVEIENGNYIGFTDKTMLVSEKLKTDTFAALLSRLNANEKNFIIVFYGKDVTEEEKELTAKIVTTQYPDVEFYSMDGGQDVYDYIIILE
jgi:dihydroxyacetone kinase-like predicted kinase